MTPWSYGGPIAASGVQSRADGLSPGDIGRSRATGCLDMDVEAGLTQFDVAVKPPAILSRDLHRFSIFDCFTGIDRLCRQSAMLLANFNLNGSKIVNVVDHINLLAGTARSLRQVGRDGCYILVGVPDKPTE
jgi:hypothetical protein